MELQHIVYLLVAFIILRFWWQTMQAREVAEKLAREACKRENVQLLDGTVSLKKIRIRWLTLQSSPVLRYFSFEFTHSGEERREGTIALSGLNQQILVMNLDDNTTIDVKPDHHKPQ